MKKRLKRKKIKKMQKKRKFLNRNRMNKNKFRIYKKRKNNKKKQKKIKEKKKQQKHLYKMLIKLGKIILQQVKLRVKKMYMIGWNGQRMFASKDQLSIIMITQLDIDFQKYWFKKIKIQKPHKNISKVSKKLIKIS